jgi:RNA polymerase sigma factor (sigma-70 family)
MGPTNGTVLLRHIRKLVGASCPDQQPDALLLRKFIGDGDEAAFASLVQRHGTLVLGVCRSVLHHHHDAEDVFQATFLVLARKAYTIRRQQSLSSWLHGVAYRLASKAKVKSDRRRSREQHAAPPLQVEGSDDLSWRELRGVLHEELQRLPDKYRAPLLLCYWEGQTRDEAAALLGWTKGTLKERLERARNLLHSRLARRGLAPSATLFAVLFLNNAADANPYQLLTQTTVQAAKAFAAGQGEAARLLAQEAVTLAEGALRSMRLTKWAMICAVTVVLGGLGWGLGLLTQQALHADQPDEPSATVTGAKPKAVSSAQGATSKAPSVQPGVQEKKDGDKKAPVNPNDLIKAAIKRPDGGDNYPVLPALSTPMRGQAANEILGSDAVRQAYEKLDAVNRRNVDWFDGVAELEKHKAVWCLLSCLCHYHADVQIHALRSLERLGDKRAVPFLLLYAEHMAVFIGGSENATIHGIIHQSVAQTLSTLTGVRVEVKGQDPSGLHKGLKQWRKWLVEQDKDSP